MTMTDDKPAVKKETNYSKGLEGVVAAETALSLVDGQAGKLYYRGIDVADLARNSSYEEICCLLLNGSLPVKKELDGFAKKLAASRVLPAGFEKLISLTPKKTHPMAMLRTSASSLSFFDKQADVTTREELVQKGLRTIGVLPTIIAAFDRVRKGKKPVTPKKNLSQAANFLYMLSGELPKEEHAKALDAYLILLADHGLNASTFSARVTVATLSDYYSGIASAVGTLKGSLHGSANQKAMEMFLEIGDLKNVESYVKGLLQNHQKIMGFGHRIYKTEDPRATVFRRIAAQICNGTKFQRWYEISEKVAEIVQREKKIYCNVDFYSASVLYAVGIPVDLFTPVFAMSRIVGWTAHIIEQLSDNRLIRPQAEYTGPRNQSYIPIAER